MKCKYCHGDVADDAQKCRFCGEWLNSSSLPQHQNVPAQAAPPPQAVHPQTVVNVQREESVVFAVITLLLYIFVYPVGLILNFVGLLTGPKRGCFFSMFMLLFLVPTALVVGLVVTGASLGIEFLDKPIEGLRERFYSDNGSSRPGSSREGKTNPSTPGTSNRENISSNATQSRQTKKHYLITYWDSTDAEVNRVRSYLRKQGFLEYSVRRERPSRERNTWHIAFAFGGVSDHTASRLKQELYYDVLGSPYGARKGALTNGGWSRIDSRVGVVVTLF